MLEATICNEAIDWLPKEPITGEENILHENVTVGDEKLFALQPTTNVELAMESRE